jgi:4-aminobutyrate aminotransferase-like enzyme
MYFNTFGGNPVSAAVGLAVLDVLRDERLLDNAKTVGDYVVAGLHELQAKHALIGDVRGRGLFFAVEMVKDRATREPAIVGTKQIVNGMRERGVLISRIGPHDNILKIRPPMPFSKENADLLLNTLDDVMTGL